MIKRLLKKNSEQLVKKFEYHRVALQQEIEQRQRQQQQVKRLYQEPHKNILQPPALPPHSPPKTTPSYAAPPMPNSILPHRLHPQYSAASQYPPITNYYSSSADVGYHKPVTSTVQSTDQYNGSEETFV